MKYSRKDEFVAKLSKNEKLALLFLKHVCGYQGFTVQIVAYQPRVQYSIRLKTPGHEEKNFSLIYAQMSVDWAWNEALNAGLQLWLSPFIENLWLGRVNAGHGQSQVEVISSSQMETLLITAIKATSGIDPESANFDFFENH